MRLLPDSFRRRLDARFDAIRSLAPGTVIPEGTRHRHTVEELRPGAFLSWADQVWRVEAVHRYTEKPSWTWHEAELLSLDSGRAAWLEWEKDDALEVTATLARLPADELTDGDGRPLDGATLHRLVDKDCFEDEPGMGAVVWRGIRAIYRDSGRATFFRDGAGAGEKVWAAEFAGIGKRFVALEVWDGDEVDAFLCEPVSADAIQILSLGA